MVWAAKLGLAFETEGCFLRWTDRMHEAEECVVQWRDGRWCRCNKLLWLYVVVPLLQHLPSPRRTTRVSRSRREAKAWAYRTDRIMGYVRYGSVSCWTPNHQELHPIQSPGARERGDVFGHLRSLWLRQVYNIATKTALPSRTAISV